MMGFVANIKRSADSAYRAFANGGVMLHSLLSDARIKSRNKALT